MKKRVRTVVNTKDSHFAEIVRHSYWAMLMLVAATVIQFSFDLLLTNTYGAHSSGIFYLSFSILMVLALLGRLGLDQAVIRFMPHLLKTNPGAADGVRSTAVRLSLMLTVPLSVALFFAAPWLATDIFKSIELTDYLRVFALGIPPFSLMYVFSGTLRAMKHTKSALSIERAGMYTFGIIAMLTLGALSGLWGFAVGFIIGLYLTAIIGATFIKRYMPVYRELVPFSKTRLLVVAGPLLFVAFASQISGQVSVLILGAESTSADVAVFNIALKVSMLMSLILAAVNVIISTKISELYAAGKKEQLRIVISKVSALGTVFGLPLLIFMLLFETQLLSLFGSEFTAGALTLSILAFGQFINVAVGSTNYALAMTGREKTLAVIVGVSLIVNITLGILLIPTYGVLGAGISTAVTLILNNVLAVIIVRRHLDAWALPFKYINVWFNGLVK